MGTNIYGAIKKFTSLEGSYKNMITINQAKQLRHGQILYHTENKNADGTPQRWRVNGKVKLWKRDSNRIEIPIKHGLYGYDYLTEHTLGCLCLNENLKPDPQEKII